ncbi:class I SAM-dependent methyltransferase [Mesorhizobium sp. M1005]|uniref:class I SAM-dependent methyltransferase n=1 Tax=unclassified Mesorhizobium TaxID=325217 RepID=UPI00333B3FB1
MNRTALQPAVKWGDFSPNASEYGQRPPYSDVVLSALARTVTEQFGPIWLAELGAGTGNLLRSFKEAEIGGFAVEPNKDMRAVARKLAPNDQRFEWVEGTAEQSNLPPASVNWVLLGNAYQFVDPLAMFAEAHRILVPGGFLTLIWNVRHFRKDPLQCSIEEMVKRLAGSLKRTGISVAEIMDSLDTGERFLEVLYAEASHKRIFTPDRFLATWKAGHDVPSQVSADMWRRIIKETERMIPDQPAIETIWLTRAWTLQAQ